MFDIIMSVNVFIVSLFNINSICHVYVQYVFNHIRYEDLRKSGQHKIVKCFDIFTICS